MNAKVNKEKALKILLAPKITEKTNRLKADRQYVFKVRKEAVKTDIAATIKQLFNVEVELVRICNMEGKPRKFGQISGKRKDYKKAYVTLKEGYEIKSE